VTHLGAGGKHSGHDVPYRPVPAHRQWTPLGRALTVAGDNWTLIIAMQLAPGRTRLSHLRERLAGVSAGVLDRYLNRMADAELITRTRFREMPPRVEIELTEAGRELLPIAGALARWGVRRAWSAPKQGERVDIDALFRLLPLLIEQDAKLPDGTVELALTEPKGRMRHLLRIHDGRVQPDFEHPGTATTALAAIEGDREAWMAALGPMADASGLKLDGDEVLARRILAAIPGPPVTDAER
jgi:DNA-binding HxlR family transcriptional regulator